MIDLNFSVEAVEPVPHAASPFLSFRLRVDQVGVVPIHSIALRCQVRIDAAARTYDPDEQERLAKVFGEHWKQSLSSLLWTHASAIVPAFTASGTTGLPVPCMGEFNVAASKYLSTLEVGDIPVILLFSGSIFYADNQSHLQVEQIPWSKEAPYRVPVHLWKQLMESYRPMLDQLARNLDRGARR
jgi:hypothetical protein